MTNVTCGLTAKKLESALCPTFVIEYGTTLFFQLQKKLACAICVARISDSIGCVIVMQLSTASVVRTLCWDRNTLFILLLVLLLSLEINAIKTVTNNKCTFCKVASYLAYHRIIIDTDFTAFCYATVTTHLQ